MDVPKQTIIYQLKINNTVITLTSLVFWPSSNKNNILKHNYSQKKEEITIFIIHLYMIICNFVLWPRMTLSSSNWVVSVIWKYPIFCYDVRLLVTSTVTSELVVILERWMGISIKHFTLKFTEWGMHLPKCVWIFNYLCMPTFNELQVYW